MDYLVSGPEMRELDRQTIEEFGVPGRVLMEVAGRAVADVCLSYLDRPSQVVIACGRGNNGGDGFVTARALAAQGHAVRVFVFGEITRIRGAAAAALKTLDRACAATVSEVTDARALLAFSSFLESSQLVVDALLGTGLNAEVRGLVADAIQLINDCSAPCIAVDIASGVDSDTGAVLGRAVHADHTVTFGFAKRGHYLYPGAGSRGRITVADIGIPAVLADRLGVVARVIDASDGPNMLRPRHGESHKGHYGHAVVLAGSVATPGAAVLALRGALRSGAGLVSWATDEDTLGRALLPPEVMIRLRRGEQADTWAERVLDGATSVIVGPGYSTSSERVDDMHALLVAARVPVCVDADGLNILAQRPELWSKVRCPVVATPHPKEMARLLACQVSDVQRDRVASASQLAMSRSCVVALKGAGTVVAEPDGTATVIGAGSPALATGGTGDVLAGAVGGFLAQRFEVTAAAQLGTLLHACAGEHAARTFGEAGTCATDVADAMGNVLAAWGR